MLRRVDLRSLTSAELASADLPAMLAAELPRAALDVTAAVEQVAPVCQDVRQRGAAAVRDYTNKFDGVDRESSLVPQAELDKALAALDPQVRAALAEAARRARLVHQAQLPAQTVTTVAPGSTVTERYLPVRRAGVYVPGGLVAYPSSVLMNVIPAQVAGVSEIAVASPPRPAHGGQPHPAVLAACALLGVTEVHAAGGAQAIAMLGYGTADCAPVDVITGPGNVYVAAAKRVLSAQIAVDAEAGPTEVAIVADDTADAGYVAADLIAQAEHDPLAACLLITSSAALAGRVDAELAVAAPAARHAGRVQAALTGQSACALVADAEAAMAVCNAWAPEHLEILAGNEDHLAGLARNAGAVFVGPWAPVSLGDYLAGSNHVLPTGGTARHSGGLTTGTFLRCQHVVRCDRAALAVAAPYIEALGGAEDLAAHVQAVRIRVAG
jgi:histidinol dehydrogenase